MFMIHHRYTDTRVTMSNNIRILKYGYCINSITRRGTVDSRAFAQALADFTHFKTIHLSAGVLSAALRVNRIVDRSNGD